MKTLSQQLAIEPFLIDTLIPKRVQVRVRKAIRFVNRTLYGVQLTFNFWPKKQRPEGLYETFKQFDRSKGIWVTVERRLDFTTQKRGVVGSPVKMRKIKKDTPYLQGI